MVGDCQVTCNPQTLCTFSGRNGDILWSLATAREISKQKNEKVDFAIMPQYKNLLPLIELQSYISEAYALEEWKCTGSPCGDQPWEAPVEEGKYNYVFHLTYRSHPGIGGPAMPLIDFIAWQQGVQLSEPVIPFITAAYENASFASSNECVIPYAFNAMLRSEKEAFLNIAKARSAPNMFWRDMSQFDWRVAAKIISGAGIFVGDRSACWVLAVGLGVPTITYEPNVSRSAYGQFGQVFGCPYAKEVALHAHADAAAAVEELQKLLSVEEMK